MPSRASRWAFLLLCALTTWPLWIPRYLPIQDLPQHLAAIRVIHSYADPAFGFQRYFEVDLFRTQYLVYYLAAHLLGFVMDLELANRVLVVGCVLATPLALLSLLRSLDRDPRYALFALPLAYNAHLILGFVNFLMAIVLALYGLALAVRQRRAPTHGRAVGLAVVAVAGFYSHVVPFALFGLGCAAIALGRDWRRIALRLLPLVPAGLAALAWMLASPAGRATVTAASGGGVGPQPVFVPAAVALADLPNWLTDVLHGELDRTLLRWFVLVLALALCAGALPGGQRDALAPAAGPPADDPDRALTRSLVRRLTLLAPIAAVLYFVAPSGYDWIWPIAQRFPLLALLLLIPVLPRLSPGLANAVALALVMITLLQVREVARAFSAFDEHEVADFDAALDSIPPAQRVVGLIYARGSREVKFSPFIQFVAYYQARKGGAVMFSFADFPQSPFRFREESRPPRVPPRWEWLPQRVRGSELAWYDYALVRAGPGPCSQQQPMRCSLVHRGRVWNVWKLE